MDIRNKVGKISLNVENKDLNIHIQFDGVETEMVGLTPMEYIQILKMKNEMSQLSKETISNILSGIREAFEDKAPTKKPFGYKMDDMPAEELLKHLPFLKGAQVVKVDPKDILGKLFKDE